MIKGVLLDIDGTLVLSNDAHAQSWVEAFAHYGYDVTFDEVRPLIGMGGDKLIPQLVPGLSEESGRGKQVKDFRSKLFHKKYVAKLQPAPGSRELVQRLQTDGFKLMVASSASQSELQALLGAAQVDDLLKQATTSDDAKESKPDPDIVHAALAKLGLPARQALMLGDTPYDIEAASRAGVGLIAVRCGGWSDQDLSGATVIYDDPAGIVAHYDASPFKLKQSAG